MKEAAPRRGRGGYTLVALLVGMTVASEATLAAELELPYAALCSVDNYCNGIGRAPLTYAAIVRTQERNAARSEAILAAALEALR